MLEVQHELATAVATLVAGDPAASVPEFDVQRVGARFHAAARGNRHRVGVGLDHRAALLVHQRKRHVRQVEPLRHARQQVIALGHHRHANRLRAPVQDPRLVPTAAVQQKGVQRIEVGDARHRDEVVAAEVAALALHAAFLMTLARRAELRPEAPMRPECHEPDRLLPPVALQDLAHGTGQVVVAQQPEHPAEIGERVLVCL